MLLKFLNLLAFISPTLVFARLASISPANNPNSYLTARGIESPITFGSRPYIWNINPVDPNVYEIESNIPGDYVSVDFNEGIVVISDSPEYFLLSPINENQFHIDMVNVGGSWTVTSTPGEGNIIKSLPYDNNVNQHFIIRYLEE